jgi:hypothetical protein
VDIVDTMTENVKEKELFWDREFFCQISQKIIESRHVISRIERVTIASKIEISVDENSNFNFVPFDVGNVVWCRRYQTFFVVNDAKAK